MKFNLDLGKVGLGILGAGVAILGGFVEEKKMEYVVEKKVDEKLSKNESEEKEK